MSAQSSGDPEWQDKYDDNAYSFGRANTDPYRFKASKQDDNRRIWKIIIQYGKKYQIKK